MRKIRCKAIREEARNVKASGFLDKRISARQIYRRLKKKHNRGY